MSVILAEDFVTAKVLEDGLTKEQQSCRNDLNDRKETKTRMKRLIYRLLAAYTGQTLPRDVTGIRPVKIAMQLWNRDGAIRRRKRLYAGL